MKFSHNEKKLSAVCIAIIACGLITLPACKVKPQEANVQTCAVIDVGPVTVPAGTGTVGADKAYPEERPVREVTYEAFNIDATEVTYAQFSKFVEATGYVTTAEKPQAGFDGPGAAVFTIPTPTNPSWWTFVEGANWRHPEGPESVVENDQEPVVQVSYEDAAAYAAWTSRRLPTEDEWERAAKAGSDTLYVWGDERAPDGIEHANTWQGVFPIQNTADDGYFKRAPVGCYEPNASGIYDMIGNVWEWTNTVYEIQRDELTYTIKGGSFLCAENYCRRYRASAKQPQEGGFPTNHIGFRTVSDK